MINPADFAALPAHVARPRYDRSKLTVGIAHVGVGGFHRAHQAMYLDRLLQSGFDDDWAIVGIGLLPGDAVMRDALRGQSFAYTLVLKHPDGSSDVQVIGSIVDYVFAPDDPAAAVERLADPAIRIVSLTVTEGGYHVNQASGEFDAGSADILHDLRDPARPRTVFGVVVEALRVRRERGIPAFTVLSCDNVMANGSVARHAFSSFASLRDPELGSWVRDSVSFPSTMVDRITPQTTDDHRRELAASHGIDDAWPVIAEPFAQWVIEDRFPLGRPQWQRVGAQLVDDVAPYELMKLRLLNASHQAMAYFGSLLGYAWAHEAASDPLVTRLLERYWSEEAIPTLPEVPGVDLSGYTTTLLERYRNPAIRDTLARLCAETSDRIPTFLLPVVRSNLDAGRPIAMSAAVVASWAHYVDDASERGRATDVVDARRDRVMAAARRARTDPPAFLEDPEIFGTLATDQAFADAFTTAFDLLRTRPVREGLAMIVGHQDDGLSSVSATVQP